MDRATRKLTIAALQACVASLQITCDAYSKEFERERLTLEQKSLIARRWDTALGEWRSLLFTLEQLRNAQRMDQGVL